MDKKSFFSFSKFSVTLLLLLIFSILALVFLNGCSENKTHITYITGNVISKPANLIETKLSQTNITINITGNNTLPQLNASHLNYTKLNQTINPTSTPFNTNSVRFATCDMENIALGFKACYNTTEGNAEVILKNVGRYNISGLIFNIEVNGKANYEVNNTMLLAGKKDPFTGRRDGPFVTFILDINKWKEKYKSTDRIIIIPVYNDNGLKACFNRALLLVPKDSCTKGA